MSQLLMSRLTKSVAALGSIMLVIGCSSNTLQNRGPYSARWVKHQINLYETPTKQATSRVTRKVIYGGNAAYLIPSPCCDKFDYLYDGRGSIVCAPSGGLTGRGDGNCPAGLGTAPAKDR